MTPASSAHDRPGRTGRWHWPRPRGTPPCPFTFPPALFACQDCFTCNQATSRSGAPSARLSKFTRHSEIPSLSLVPLPLAFPLPGPATPALNMAGDGKTTGGSRALAHCLRNTSDKCAHASKKTCHFHAAMVPQQYPTPCVNAP